MNLIYSDDFNAPINAEFPLAGTPWIKHQGRGVFKVNDLLSIGSGWNIALTASIVVPSPNHAVEFTVSGPLSKGYALARMTRLTYTPGPPGQSGIVTGYMLRVYADKVRLEKLSAAGIVVLGEMAIAIPVGQVMRLESVADLHSVSVNGDVLLAAIDDELATGNVGIGAPGMNTLKYTDFRAYSE